MNCVATCLIACVVTGIACGFAQQAPTFEAASIKVNKSEAGRSGISGLRPGRFVATATPLKFVILYAWQLRDHQLIGLPEWTESINFDISAVYGTDRPASEQDVRLMVQQLLRDRFGLVLHIDRRVIPAYDLTLVHNKPKMMPSSIDCQRMIAEKMPLRDAGGASSLSPTGKRPACRILATRRYLTGGGITVEQLATALQSMLGKPVVDRTGLRGAFDIDLSWTLMDDAAGNAPPGDAPSIFSALQEQLGLRVEMHKEPFDVMIIEKVTLPAPD